MIFKNYTNKITQITKRQLNESFHYEEIPNDIVIFYNGKWHDCNGNEIDLDRQQIEDILNDIKTMESTNYQEMEDYIMFDDIDCVDDIFDYLECDEQDAFIFFKGTDISKENFINKEKEKYSPISQKKEYSKSLYMLASINKIKDLIGRNIPLIGEEKMVEIADICGSFDRNVMYLIKYFCMWMENNDVKGFFCDAREKTSNRILNGNVFVQLLDKKGFVKL